MLAYNYPLGDLANDVITNLYLCPAYLRGKLGVPHEAPDRRRFPLRAQLRRGSFMRDTQRRALRILVSPYWPPAPGRG